MVMEFKELPTRAGLEEYEKQAEDYLNTLPAGDSTFTLAEVHLEIARWNYFESWAELTEYVEEVTRENSPIFQFESAVDAIVAGDVATLERLLREHPELIRARSTRRHHATLLHYVGANGTEKQRTPKNAVDVAKILLQAGAEVNAVGEMYGGTTALGLVATSVHPWLAGVQEPLMEILLEHGAGLEGAVAPNYTRGSLVNACLANGRPQAAEFLAKRGARLDLAGAAGVGMLDVVKSFFDEGGVLKATATKEDMDSGFEWACMYGRNSVIDFLLEKGVDLRAKENTGQTALHCAVIGGHLDIVKLLLERGAPLEAKNEYGGTVLGQATWCVMNFDDRVDYVPIVETLLDAGAKVEEADYPTGNERVDDVLRRHGAKGA
jgi:ankyrin repeat protein